MKSQLVLSLFPGIGLLDHAFEEAGFCIVRGPDVLWGGDIRRFHPPAGKFDGVIGGPPCQCFSALKRLNPKAGERFGNLIPEFERCVKEATPQWFLMENVPQAPVPVVEGYSVRNFVINNRQFGEAQERTRRWAWGTPDNVPLLPEVRVFDSFEYVQAVTSSSQNVPVKRGGSGKVKRTYTADGKRHGPNDGVRTPIATMLALQGFPETLLDDAPFTDSGKRKAIGNGVPLAMGRALARAVREAVEKCEAELNRFPLLEPKQPKQTELLEGR
jgi:DNA (cytosine-5)-methyltransferase 1